MKMEGDTEKRNKRGWEEKQDRNGSPCQSRAKTGAEGAMT